MGIFKAIGDFLFGKDPEIFNEKGEVQHRLPERKWQAWDARLRQNPDYDWRQHVGKKLGKATPSKDQTSKN